MIKPHQPCCKNKRRNNNRIRSVLDRAYDRYGIMPKTSLEASDQNIIYQLACSAQGAAFLPPMILFDHKKGSAHGRKTATVFG